MSVQKVGHKACQKSASFIPVPSVLQDLQTCSYCSKNGCLNKTKHMRVVMFSDVIDKLDSCKLVVFK